MANTNAPFGLRPVRTIQGNPYNGQCRRYAVAAADATAIFIGDPVLIDGTGSTIGAESFQNVTKAATTDIVQGVVVGVQAETRDSLPYRAASTQRVLYVCDDPDMLYLVQEANSGTAFTVNDIGLNCSLTLTAGSTVTGVSGAVL